MDRFIAGARGRRRQDGAGSERASRRPTRSWKRRGAWASTPEHAVVFEDALAGVAGGPRRRLLHRRRRPRRPARGAARSTAPTSSSTTSESCCDHPSGVQRRAVGGERGPPQARGARPGRVGVRALQRPHRPAREPGRGRAVRPARHLPQRLLRDPPAAVRGGRLRLPGGRPDRRQRHQRQAHPAAGRRRAVRHPLRRAARPHALAGPARGRAPAPRSLALAERPRDRGQLHAPGLVRAALGGRDPLRGQGDRRPAAADRRPVRARGQRAQRHPDPRPARRRRAGGAAGGRGAGGQQPARRARPPHAQQQAADGGGHGPRRREGRRDRRRRRGGRRPRPRVADGRAAARQQPAVHEVPGLRLVEPALAAVRARPGRRRGVVAPSAPAGRSSRRSSASTWTRSGSTPTWRSTATASSSRPSASRSSTRCRPAPAPSGAPSRPRA